MTNALTPSPFEETVWHFRPEAVEVEETGAKYSFLSTDPASWADPSEIRRMLGRGVKVILFCAEGEKSGILEGNEAFLPAKLLQVYPVSERLPAFTVLDGAFEKRSQLELLASRVPAFNAEQYEIEHAPASRHVFVQAGAGTGKTTVMIDRILFLLHTVPNIQLSDIAMITFTNEATSNMKRRIQDALLKRYDAVKDLRYLEMLEHAAELKISTIHSFSKDIISQICTSAGYGSSLALRSFRYEKRQIIRDVLNEQYASGDGRAVDRALGATLHELEDLILGYWSQLDNIGFTEEDIAALDWGSPSDRSSAALNETLRTVFPAVFRRYAELKQQENAISVEDIIRELRQMLRSSNEIALKQRPYRFLFVDEFQDTDNAQIEAIAWLANTYGMHVFAVGDIKQSIYRFRGAVETAFERLRAELTAAGGEAPGEYHLLRNYRTSPDLMKKMDAVFRSLESRKLLVYEKSLLPQRVLPGHYEKIYYQSKFFEQTLLTYIGAALDNCQNYAFLNHLEDSDTQKVVVLARANYQLRQVGDLCRKKGIPCYIREEGTLFLSRAAADLCAMLRAYLYPGSAEALFDLLASPYASGRLEVERLSSFAPGSPEQRAFLRRELESYGYEEHLKAFRLLPVLSVMRDIVEDPAVLLRFSEQRRRDLWSWEPEKREAQIRIDCRQYQKDLECIVMLIKDSFNGDMTSLGSVYEFLRLKIAVDRSSDEPDISDVCGPGCLYGMTVHKAKGLEFDTVLLPYTNKLFRQMQDTELLFGEADGKRCAGWARVLWADEYKSEVACMWSNSWYDLCSKKEMLDTAREEARILYVAMTRAIRNLYLFSPVRTRSNTWADLL